MLNVCVCPHACIYNFKNKTWIWQTRTTKEFIFIFTYIYLYLYPISWILSFMNPLQISSHIPLNRIKDWCWGMLQCRQKSHLYCKCENTGKIFRTTDILSFFIWGRGEFGFEIVNWECQFLLPPPSLSINLVLTFLSPFFHHFCLCIFIGLYTFQTYTFHTLYT